MTYEIEPAGDGTIRLTLTQSHDRPISDDILSGGRTGWPAILSSLKSLLETGEALVIKMEPPQRMLAALKEDGDQDAVAALCRRPCVRTGTHASERSYPVSARVRQRENPVVFRWCPSIRQDTAT